MKKIVKETAWFLIPLAIAFFMVLLFFSCSDEGFNDSDFVAGSVFTDSNIRVMLIDTITVETSTMKFDSIITSESDRILVGKYTDPIFGVVETSSYLEILPSSYTIDSEAEFDSIVCYLAPDKYYYNDTLQTNTIHIKRLSENMVPKNGDYFYNTSTVRFYEENMGALSYSPRPLQADSLEITLSDSLGLDFFSRLQEKQITTSDEFKEYFKGIAVQPDVADDGSIIGFSLDADKSYIRLYFSIAEEDERVQEYIDFNFNTTSTPIPFFNRISAVNPVSYLQTLTDEEVNLESSDAENQSFVQSGTGIATRIRFPYIKSLYDIQGKGTLLDAVLKIKPVQQSYNDRLILKDSLSVFIVDENNDLTQQLRNPDTSPVLAILNRENQEFNEIYYELPLATYLESLLLTEGNTENALILFPDNYNSIVDRFVLQGSAENGTVLEVIYSIYDETE